MKLICTKSFVIFSLLFLTVFACKKNKDVPKVLATVTTGASTNMTTTSATLNGSISNDGNDEITEAGFVYSSNVSQPTAADNKIKSTDTEGDFSVELNSLNSGTKYYVRAYAINSIGTAYGSVVDFTTGNAAPVVSNVAISGTLEVNKTVTATYNYTDAENDDEGETTFQWYVANDAAGAGTAVIDGATDKTFLIQEEQDGKYLRVTVTPKANTGTTNGTAVNSLFMGAVGEATTVTFMYNNEEVTYGIITTPSAKWLDRNLGAAHAATKVDDYEAYGDLFQWGRGADGHQRVNRTGVGDADVSGVNGTIEETSNNNTPATNKFIINTAIQGDWRIPQVDNLWQGVNGTNNPCPEGWRIPTLADWQAEAITNSTVAYNKLKLTYSGWRGAKNGAFTLSSYGVYWTSTVSVSQGTPFLCSYLFAFDATLTFEDATNRGSGVTCRCIKE